MAEPELEWVEESTLKGDSACFCFSGNVRAHPIEKGTFSVDPPAKRVDLMEAIGRYTLIFEPAPASGMPIKIRYAWRPPRLRRALVLVRTDIIGGTSWVTMNELRDAIHRGSLNG